MDVEDGVMRMHVSKRPSREGIVIRGSGPRGVILGSLLLSAVIISPSANAGLVLSATSMSPRRWFKHRVSREGHFKTEQTERLAMSILALPRKDVLQRYIRVTTNNYPAEAKMYLTLGRSSSRALTMLAFIPVDDR